MKYIFAVLLALLPAGASFAQSEDPNKLVYNEDDNPPNWCRNGHFPALTESYGLGELIRPSAMFGDEDGCPSKEPGRCEASNKVEAGVQVAVSKTFGDFYCTFDPRDQSAGWLDKADIRLLPAPDIKEADWLGTWTDGSNGITIESGKDGLHVTGAAQWLGATLESGEQVVHVGDIDFVARPKADRLTLTAEDEYDCAVELIHLGRFLVVRDNSHCGGANVRFNGVYLRKG